MAKHQPEREIKGADVQCCAVAIDRHGSLDLIALCALALPWPPSV
jgi:hypothetical protein